MKKRSLPSATAKLATAIVGIWKLKSREDVDATGKVHIDPFLGPNPLGILCFGKTHFSAQFMKHDRSAQETVLQPVQAKNNTARVNDTMLTSASIAWMKSKALSPRVWKARFLRLILATLMLEMCG
jgi:hypothetical protein